MTTVLRCPECGGRLMHSDDDGNYKFRVDGPLELRGQQVWAKCHWCGSDTPLPLQMAKPTFVITVGDID